MTCNMCPLSIPHQVAGAGAFESRLIVIGDYPLKEDEKSGVPFSYENNPNRDYPGKLMRMALRPLGLNVNTEVYMTYALRCNPFHRAGKVDVKPQHLTACRTQNLDPELSNITAPVILAAGPYAMQTLLPDLSGGFLKHRGKWHETTIGGRRRLVRVTFPPSQVIRLSLYESIVDDDTMDVSRGKPIAPIGTCRSFFINDLKAVREKLLELSH